MLHFINKHRVLFLFRRVWVFSDTPHLMKLLRHHVLDSGMRLEDGTVLNAAVFNAVLRLQATSEMKACHKLTPLHVTVRYFIFAPTCPLPF